ncbi:MAG: DUF2232 domain-containing protein [Gemmatimonadaceae bacterium]
MAVAPGAGEPAAPAREAGWRRFLPALLLFLLVPQLGLGILAPLQETITFVAPGMAVCALLGWKEGGRWSLVVIWTALAVWTVVQPISPDPTYDGIARSWVLLLAATFGLVCVLYGKGSFFPRALTATVLTLALVGGMLVIRPGALEKYGATLRGQIEQRGAQELAKWNAMTSTPEWQEMEEKSQAMIDVSAEVERQWNETPKATASVAPALLALESLAALALVWGLFHRVSRVRLGPPLSALREFRFNDQLIWALVVGSTLVVLPTLAPFRSIGVNFLVFVGVLYLVRGLGVVASFLTPQRIALALPLAIAFLFWPKTMAVFSLGLGVGDTWFDLRRRLRPTS